jgi:hypothetical protein
MGHCECQHFAQTNREDLIPCEFCRYVSKCKHEFPMDSVQPVCMKCGKFARQHCPGCHWPMEAKLGFCWKCEESFAKG